MKTILNISLFTICYITSTAYAYNKNCKLETQIIANNGFEVVLTKATSSKNKHKQAIVILPPTGGKNLIDNGYAKYFCKNGFDSFILTNWTNDDEFSIDLGIHNRYMDRAQTAFFNSLEYLYQLGYNIQMLATSAGGFIANVAMGDSRIAKYVSSYFNIVSGSPLCSAIATAGEKTLKKIRDIRIREYNFKDAEDYERTLCQMLNWQIPTKKPDKIRFGFIKSSEDKTVLSKYQEQLHNNWKPSFSKTIASSHFITIVKSHYLYKKKILNFFKDPYELE